MNMKTYISAILGLIIFFIAAGSANPAWADNEMAGEQTHEVITGAQKIAAEEIDEIRISMYYQNRNVSGYVVYPTENSEGIKGIVKILNSAAPTGKKSVTDVPPYDRFIKVEILPDKTVYLYQEDGKYYAEIPYVSIGELTKEAYENILENFGPIRSFPEDTDKTQFLAAIQDILEPYRSGNPPENQMELKFHAAPEDISLPYVNSVDDFELRDGDGTEYLYRAVIHYGEKNAYFINMGLIQWENRWTVAGVSFGGPDTGIDVTTLDNVMEAENVPEEQRGSYTLGINRQEFWELLLKMHTSAGSERIIAFSRLYELISQVSDGQVRFIDYPSGVDFIQGVPRQSGSVQITDEMREKFNLFARDYRLVYLPDMDGYESFFDTTRYADSYGYPNFADAVFYVLQYLGCPEKVSAGDMQDAIKNLFAAKDHYDAMPHQAYRKFAEYQNGYYSPWPESGLDHNRIFYLLESMDIDHDNDQAIRITVRAKSYYFNDTSVYEAGDNEKWLEKKAKELGKDELQTATTLTVRGEIGELKSGTEYETVILINPSGPRGLNPQFVSHHSREI